MANITLNPYLSPSSYMPAYLSEVPSAMQCPNGNVFSVVDLSKKMQDIELVFQMQKASRDTLLDLLQANHQHFTFLQKNLMISLQAMKSLKSQFTSSQDENRLLREENATLRVKLESSRRETVKNKEQEQDWRNLAKDTTREMGELMAKNERLKTRVKEDADKIKALGQVCLLKKRKPHASDSGPTAGHNVPKKNKKTKN